MYVTYDTTETRVFKAIMLIRKRRLRKRLVCAELEYEHKTIQCIIQCYFQWVNKHS